MRALPPLLLTALALWSGSFTAPAITILAEADTFVQNSDTTANGSSIQWGATNDGGSAIPKTKDQIGVFRFNSSAITGPALSVTLTLNPLTDLAQNYILYGIADGGPDEDFNESTLVFTDFAYSSTVNNGSFDSTGLVELATFATPATAASVDISSAALLNFVNANTNSALSFVVYRTTENGTYTYFASRENTSVTGPELTVEVIPEPQVGLLLAGALLPLLARRRRRA